MANPHHVVVIAFENRSFDHMLGFVPPAGALTGQESNPVNPADPASERVAVTRLAGPITSIDPNHSLEAVDEQVFGASVEQPDPAPMNGFVSSYIKNVGGDVAKGKAIMDCHSPESVPVLAGLAKNYRVCTRWFSSVPGQTWPNRFFMHAATSRGLVTNDPLDEDAPTIFDKLDAKQSWRIYAGDVPQSLSIESLAARFVLEHLKAPQDRHFHTLAQYFRDLTEGTLPAYSFIEPQYFNTAFGQATDQHPPHDIRLGEALLGHVYNSLLASTYWQDSLLLVLFDEHGGFFDSVPPPRGVAAPDAFVASQPAFDFTRLGPRVPAVVVSPWVEPGVDVTQYEHASIPATLNALFELGSANFLTKRDAAANAFNTNLSLTSAHGLLGAFQADTATAPPLEQLAPPAARLPDTRAALQTVLDVKGTAPLSSFSSHQRRLLELSSSLMHDLG
ncbi:MAG: alkaline phosphatase family protein [Chloroflexota bacterium]